MSAYEAAGETDEWYTPPEVFEALGCRFYMDVAAPIDRTHIHTPADEFLTENSLGSQWLGFIWMNPPFGHQSTKRRWLNKFFAYGHGIALTPDRTSAPWFREAWVKADLVLFTPKLKFIRPDGSRGISPGTGTALWAAGEDAADCLRLAASRGLGILAQPLK